MKILIKDVFQKREPSDGVRILVDEKLPSGLDEYKAQLDMWLKPILPSERSMDIIRDGFERWDEFEASYFEELGHEKDLWVDQIMEKAKDGNVTLLYSTDDPDYNNAVAVRDYIMANEKRLIDRVKKAA